MARSKQLKAIGVNEALLKTDNNVSPHLGQFLCAIREHTEKSFRNLIKSTRNQNVINIFRLIWNQTDVRLVPNQSENGKYNLISG